MKQLVGFEREIDNVLGMVTKISVDMGFIESVVVRRIAEEDIKILRLMIQELNKEKIDII